MSGLRRALFLGRDYVVLAFALSTLCANNWVHHRAKNFIALVSACLELVGVLAFWSLDDRSHDTSRIKLQGVLQVGIKPSRNLAAYALFEGYLPIPRTPFFLA